MIQNHEQLKAIIIGFDTSQFTNASYNLTIGQIIDMDSKIVNDFTLKPQGMVYVVMKEQLKVPMDVIGFAHVKTSLTKRGIMATNIGIIDCGYEGYISTLLINFGKNDCFLSEGDPALRITFAEINKPKENIPIKNEGDHTAYTKNVRRDITNLDDKFLNLNSVKTDVTNRVFKVMIGLAIVFAAGNFFLSAYFNHKSTADKDVDLIIKRFENQVLKIESENKLLKMQFDAYKKRDSLK